MFTLNPAKPWTVFQKISFRLLFLCLGLFLLDYEMGMLSINLNLYKALTAMYASPSNVSALLACENRTHPYNIPFVFAHFLCERLPEILTAKEFYELAHPLKSFLPDL